MGKIYFISDTHFNDEFILRSERHEFKSMKEMTMEIVKQWQSVVTDEDTVFHLGDIGMPDRPNAFFTPLSTIINSLPGKKILIKGNHDQQFTKKEMFDLGFYRVYEYPICIDGFYWLSHEPMYITSSMPYVNIHGHIHTNTMHTDKIPNQYVNVCVDHLKYSPKSFEDIKSEFVTSKEKYPYKSYTL